MKFYRESKNLTENNLFFEKKKKLQRHNFTKHSPECRPRQPIRARSVFHLLEHLFGLLTIYESIGDENRELNVQNLIITINFNCFNVFQAF